MCGIFGMAGREVRAEALAVAARALAHRGPDGSGTQVFDQRVGLAHTRLRVIDCSPAGDQPLSNEDGSVWLVYNGEVYGFTALREELERKGHVFRSRTDTEVIVHLYEEKGAACLDDLNGMFALCLYDRRRRRLLAARDRLGIKPLYYVHADGEFACASELKALFAAKVIAPEVNWQAISDYFSYLFVPHPATAFRGVMQLPPAHCLSYDLDSGALTITRYWDPACAARAGRDAGYLAAQQRVRVLLEDSVRLQLVSDVPLGVFLSGGIDSSVIAALAARSVGRRLKTFTVVFEGKGIAAIDDRLYARRMSEALGSEHTELTVRMDDPGPLLEVGRHFDQPFANPTLYLSYLISRETRRHVTVALSGAGGDELFAGYPRYRALRYAGALRCLPRVAGKALRYVAGAVRENPDQPAIRRMKLFLRAAGEPFAEQYLRWTYFFDEEQKQRLLHGALQQHGPFLPARRHLEYYLAQVSGPDLLARVQFADLKTFLADNILEYTDKTSMASSLEVRVPFLDHRIVEEALALPCGYKIGRGGGKRILKDLARDLVPADLLAAPKRGFCAPLATWMTGPLDRYFDEEFAAGPLVRQGLIDRGAVNRLRKEHRKGVRDNAHELFSIIMFDVWYNNFFGG